MLACAFCWVCQSVVACGGAARDPACLGAVVVRGEMQVFVRTLTGRTITVQACCAQSVLTLKVQLAEKLGVPQDQQRLVFAGKQLQDGRALRDCGVQKEAPFASLVGWCWE